jgi:NAD(P)-dependent dehydrogenase (short-subunit alcohol dehydrogenase family)
LQAEASMGITHRHTRFALFSALGVGALIAAQAWRRRDPYIFQGKSVVITGGSRGLGLVMARELADEGARLTLIARDEEELDRAVSDIRRRQPFVDVLKVVADVRRRYDAERAIAQALEHHGSIDVIINNAGVIQVGPVEHMTLADFEDAMNTHFWGPLYMMLASLPHMRRQGEGRIVNISSIGGRIGLPHLVPYSASKFALTGLSDGLRYELTRDNILITTVCPGLMRTGSPLNATFKGNHPQEYAWFAISDSLPLAAIDAERAARQIIAACRRGDAELVITVQAKLAILARTAAPELFASAMSFINSLLPDPTTREGDHGKLGRESESKWAPSALTESTDKAAEDNNEI